MPANITRMTWLERVAPGLRIELSGEGQGSAVLTHVHGVRPVVSFPGPKATEDYAAAAVEGAV